MVQRLLRKKCLLYVEGSVLFCSCYIYHKSSCIRKNAVAVESFAFPFSVNCSFNKAFSL